MGFILQSMPTLPIDHHVDAAGKANGYLLSNLEDNKSKNFTLFQMIPANLNLGRLYCTLTAKSLLPQNNIREW